LRFKRLKNVSPHSPSKDEEFIKDYLDYNGISYIAEYKLTDLERDVKKFRVVDFYLDKLDVYLEYYGMYNSTKQIRAEYDLKTKVYLENDLPTLILYPHELGYLDYAFNVKLLKLLRMTKFHNKKKLLRYKVNRYLKIGNIHLFPLSLVAFIVAIQALNESSRDYDFFFNIYLIGFALSGVLLLQFFIDIYMILVKEYYVV